MTKKIAILGGKPTAQMIADKLADHADLVVVSGSTEIKPLDTTLSEDVQNHLDYMEKCRKKDDPFVTVIPSIYE